MQLLQIRAIPKLVLFASQKNDPFIQGRDAFQKSQSRKFIYSFPLFLLIVQIFQKVNPYQNLMLIITPAWPSQQKFLKLLKISVKKPTISTSTQRSTERSCWKVESALNAYFTATNGLEDLRKNLPSEGISERGSQHMTNNKRSSSIKHYNSS